MIAKEWLHALQNHRSPDLRPHHRMQFCLTQDIEIYINIKNELMDIFSKTYIITLLTHGDGILNEPQYVA